MAASETSPTVVQHPAAPPQAPPQESQFAEQIKLIMRWRKILALRWILLLTVLGALGLWGWAVGDPTVWRFISVSGFSGLVLLPVSILYYLRAD